MIKRISDETMKAIEPHLSGSLREIIHFRYASCSPEKFLREYYPLACYEEVIMRMLLHEFGIDDLVLGSERDDALEEEAGLDE